MKEKKEISEIYVTLDDKTDGFEVESGKLANYLELDLRFRLDHDENPANIKAFLAEIPNIL